MKAAVQVTKSGREFEMQKPIIAACSAIFMNVFATAAFSDEITFTAKEAELLNQLNESDRLLSNFAANFSLLPLVQLFTSNPIEVASNILLEEGVKYIYGVDEQTSFANSLLGIAKAHCTQQANLIALYDLRNDISKENRGFFKDLSDKYQACGMN